MAKDDDDDRPKKKIVHEVGQDLALLSVNELRDRIALLKDEIARLEDQKEAGAIAEKKYKQDLRDLKFHLGKVLEKLGTKV